MTTRWIAGIVLALWIAMGLLLTLQPVHPAAGQVVTDNFIPFRTFAIYLANSDSPFWVRQFVGNLFLLLPVGLLGPMVVPALNGWARIFLVSFAISLSIEVAQLWIPNRSADVDDVMLNVAGAMLGYAIFVALGLRAPRRPALAERD